MVGLRRFVVLGVCLTSASSASAADWPCKLGPQSNNTTPESIVPWSEPPPVVWRHTVGHGFSMPIAADGLVFVHATVPDREAESVTAYDALTGKVRWSDTYDRPTYDSQLGDGPRCTPLYEAGRLYAYGVNGVLGCYEAATGKRLWQTNPYEQFKAPLPTFGVTGSPAVFGDRLIVAVGGNASTVVAYDTTTGKVVWSKFDEPAASAAPIVRTFGSSDAPQAEVIVQTSLRLLGLDPRDGTVHWEHPLIFQPTGTTSTPLLVGDRLICTSQDIGTLSLKLPNEKGRAPEVLDWRQDWGGYFSCGTTDGKGRAYVITNVLMPLPRADLRCLNLEDNKELWHENGLGYFHFAVTAGSNGRVLILDDAGSLLVAEPTDKGFNELCRTKVCGGTLVPPALSNGKLYVRDDKEVICLQLPTAEKATDAEE